MHGPPPPFRHHHLVTSHESSAQLTRRQALATLAALTGGMTAGCRLGPSESPPPEPTIRLAARPVATSTSAAPGVTRLFLHETRDGLLYVPSGLDPDVPQPLVVFLHGAGGNAASVVASFQSLADEARCVLLVPESRGPTWDLLYGGVGPDVRYIDAALKWAFARCVVDPTRIGLGGFSDGASYALFLGLANGDLMRRIAAFAPGRLTQVSPVGHPEFFIAHGLRDDVFLIDLTGRRYAEDLAAQGFEVSWREFNGGHVIPATLAREALGWMAGTAAPA